MVNITLAADRLYRLSKDAFYITIPECEVSYVKGYSQMFLNLRVVAGTHKKKERRKIAALVLTYCSNDTIKKFTKWLTDYFSKDMQMEVFDLEVSEDGKIIPSKTLEKEIKKIEKE